MEIDLHLTTIIRSICRFLLQAMHDHFDHSIVEFRVELSDVRYWLKRVGDEDVALKEGEFAQEFTQRLQRNQIQL